MNLSTSFLRLCAMGITLSVTLNATTAQPPAAPGGPGPSPTSVPPGNLQSVRTSQVLGIPSSFCGHVIDLLMKNQQRRQFGPEVGGGELFVPHLSVGVTPGDLELLGVHLVCDADASHGPTFQICMKNNSRVPIGNFRVTAVGVLGRICPHSPTAELCIPRIEPCQELSVTLQLPVTCLTMGLHGQQCPFDTLIVAVDSHDELLECNELNNVLITKRCDVVAVQSAPVDPTGAAGATTPVPQHRQAAPAVPAPEQLAQPAPQRPVSPIDNIDVDQLDVAAQQN